MFAGCGGSAQVPNPTAQTPLGRITSDSRGNEVLTGRIHTECFFEGPAYVCKFYTTTARTAKGPYPGTFTAYGKYGGGPIHESFTIGSAPFTIKGWLHDTRSAKGFRYRYTGRISGHSGNVDGKAQIDLTEHTLTETLYGL